MRAAWAEREDFYLGHIGGYLTSPGLCFGPVPDCVFGPVPDCVSDRSRKQKFSYSCISHRDYGLRGFSYSPADSLRGFFL